MPNLTPDTVNSLVQGMVLLALAPAVVGLLWYLEAALQGRRRHPASILQSYRQIWGGRKQRSVRANTGSWVFPTGPVALLVAYGVLIFATPTFGLPPLLRLDLITMMYVLALARFASSVAVLDGTGPIAAVNSSRAMYLHLHTEIGLALFLAGIALNRGRLDVAALVERPSDLSLNQWLSPQWLLLAAALAVIILYEAGRLPVGSPEGDLELAKSQEGIADQYAGRDLLLIRWAEGIKLTFLLALAVSLFPLPQWKIDSPLALPLTGLTHLAQLVGLIVILALWEATRPKLRLRRMGGPMLMSAVFSLTAILYELVTAQRS